jgi:hypothetical protein
MARRVYLHIGVMKSATSHLQGLCEQNRERLAGFGLLWCPDELRYAAVKDGLRRLAEPAREGAGWPVLVDLIRRHPGDVLLSNELLAGLPTPQIKRLVRPFAESVHVIATARDLARIIPSHWQTTIKNGKTWSWAEFSAAVCADAESDDAGETNAWFWRRHDLVAIVERWSRVVPLEHITLVTVPPGDSGMESVSDRFGSVIGVDLAGMEQPTTRRNPSLGAHSVELLRRINAAAAGAPLDDPDHRYERALGGVLADHAHLEPSYGLDDAHLRWVRARAQTMATELERRGVTVVGDLADLVPPETALDVLVDPGETDDAALLAAASRGLVGLATPFNELRLERNDLRMLLKAAVP